MSAKREGMARSWEVATRELPNFWERTQGKSWAEKVGQNKKLGREEPYLGGGPERGANLRLESEGWVVSLVVVPRWWSCRLRWKGRWRRTRAVPGSLGGYRSV